MDLSIVPSDASRSPRAANGTSARSPQEVIAWALRRFASRRLVITTAFGMEGCAMIDMIDMIDMPGVVDTPHRPDISDRPATSAPLVVHYLDTHFFFPETHALRARLEARSRRIRFVDAGTTLTPQQQEAAHGPDLWRTDPDLCCRLRKVEPMRDLLRGADAWMTAVRRDQSTTRAATEQVAWDPQFELVKVSPLALWRRDEVLAYIRERGVPSNELHDQGYPTIGCTHCTSPVTGLAPGQYSRAGRWPGSEKTECGLHGGARSAASPTIEGHAS